MINTQIHHNPQSNFDLKDLAKSFLASPQRQNSVETCLLEVMCKPQQQKKLIQVIDLQADSNSIRRCLRQVRLLKSLRHENLLALESGIIQGPKAFLQFDHLDFDLARVLSSRPLAWTADHVKFIFYQITLAVAYLHSHNIAHLELNPKNILLSKDCDLKLGGLSAARPSWLPNAPGMKMVYQDYYKAPENILNNDQNSDCFLKADIWALGCIFFELLEKKHILNYKRPYQDQLKTIFSLLGRPRGNELGFVKQQSTKNWVLSTPPHQKRNASDYLSPKNCDPVARKLLDRMFNFDPHKRPSAIEILKDPYFSQIFEKSDLKFGRNRLNPKKFRITVPDILPTKKCFLALKESLKATSF